MAAPLSPRYITCTHSFLAHCSVGRETGELYVDFFHCLSQEVTNMTSNHILLSINIHMSSHNCMGSKLYNPMCGQKERITGYDYTFEVQSSGVWCKKGHFPTLKEPTWKDEMYAHERTLPRSYSSGLWKYKQEQQSVVVEYTLWEKSQNESHWILLRKTELCQ